MPVHPLPARPQLSPRSSWEELARAYGTIAAALYDRLPELETDLEEFRAAAVAASGAAHRAEAASTRLEEAVARIELALAHVQLNEPRIASDRIESVVLNFASRGLVAGLMKIAVIVLTAAVSLGMGWAWRDCAAHAAPRQVVAPAAGAH